MPSLESVNSLKREKDVRTEAMADSSTKACHEYEIAHNRIIPGRVQQYDSVIFQDDLDDFHQNSSKSFAETYLFKSQHSLRHSGTQKPAFKMREDPVDHAKNGVPQKKHQPSQVAKTQTLQDLPFDHPLADLPERFLAKARNSVVCAHTIQQLSNKPPFLGDIRLDVFRRRWQQGGFSDVYRQESLRFANKATGLTPVQYKLKRGT